MRVLRVHISLFCFLWHKYSSNLKEKYSNIEIFLNVKVDDIYWGKKTDLSFYFGPFSAPGLQIRDERLIGKLFTAVFSSLSDDLTPL